METSKVDLALKGAKEGGIRNIVALRGGKLGRWASETLLGAEFGFYSLVSLQASCRLPPCCHQPLLPMPLPETDPPEGEEHWEAVDGGFSCGLDLVKYIRKTYGDHFGISVSGAWHGRQPLSVAAAPCRTCGGGRHSRLTTPPPFFFPVPSGYPEGHPNAITKVEDPSTLSDAEKTRVVEMEDGTYVCRDKVSTRLAGGEDTRGRRRPAPVAHHPGPPHPTPLFLRRTLRRSCST